MPQESANPEQINPMDKDLAVLITKLDALLECATKIKKLRQWIIFRDRSLFEPDKKRPDSGRDQLTAKFFRREVVRKKLAQDPLLARHVRRFLRMRKKLKELNKIVRAAVGPLIKRVYSAHYTIHSIKEIAALEGLLVHEDYGRKFRQSIAGARTAALIIINQNCPFNPTKRRGRPNHYDPEDDYKIWFQWKSAGGGTLKEFALAKNENYIHVRKAIARVRARQSRAKE